MAIIRGKEVIFTKKVCKFCKVTFSPNTAPAVICGSRDCFLKLRRETQRRYYRKNAKEIYQKNLKYLPKRIGRQKAMRFFRKLGIKVCQECGSDYRPQVHHIDFDQLNNVSSNLIMLCQFCHVKAHGKGFQGTTI